MEENRSNISYFFSLSKNYFSISKKHLVCNSLITNISPLADDSFKKEHFPHVLFLIDSLGIR